MHKKSPQTSKKSETEMYITQSLKNERKEGGKEEREEGRKEGKKRTKQG